MRSIPRFARPILGLVLILTSQGAARGSATHAFHHENVMGTSLGLRVEATTPEAARRAEAQVLETIDRLSRVLSTYDPTSELRTWLDRSSGMSRVAPEILEILTACDHWRERSGGAFDPRVESACRLWKQREGAGETPDAADLELALAATRVPAWRLDQAAGMAERLGHSPLTFDAIAKGWIVGKACASAMKADLGVLGVVLQVGGDLRVSGSLEQVISITDPAADSDGAEPLARIRVANRAVATSGWSQRGVRIDGRWYSHIIDPRTARPVEGVALATVIAPDSAEADALATALNVLTPAEGLRLVESTPGASALIVDHGGRAHRSSGWAALALASPRLEPALENRDTAHWAESRELVVDFEINRPEAEGGRYRRPYVAVWVEDKEGKPVRNLLLWVSQGGAGPFMWIPDLKRWFAADKIRKRTDMREMVFVIARPTRPPGKYSVTWDGKDDLGKPAPEGDYVVSIDAAREHGTYQNLRAPIKIGPAPFAVDLDGGVEVKSARVTYRAKRGR